MARSAYVHVSSLLRSRCTFGNICCAASYTTVKMAKKNIRAKSKAAVAAAKHKAQTVQAKLNKEARQEQLLHKTISPKSTKTKKEKSAEKHKKLLKRFAQMKQKVAFNKGDKPEIIGNLKPLRDALPSLEGIYKLVKSRKNDAVAEQSQTEQPKLSVKQKIKQKRNDIVKRVNSFEKLIKDKNFKQNPREVIAAHIRNKYQSMDECE